MRIVGELPETTSVRVVTEAMMEVYPNMAFVEQRYVMRQQLPPRQFRTVIEAARYAGFFD